MAALLEIDDLQVWYGDLQALYGVSTALDEGRVLALIGANGAGKSTLLSAVCGLLEGRAEGAVRLQGAPLLGRPAEALAYEGIALVPEGRMLFPSLSVEENLRMGMLTRRAGHWTLQRVYELFPVLQEFRTRPATALSGGQQQMVAIGRALLANPRLLLCDEISLGLAPVIVRQIYESLQQVRAQGMAIVLVEQDVQRACRMADAVCCLLKGRVTLQGKADAFDHARIAQAYFGH
ncbi:MAG TPA: ABC transporter ATP-binding protein [Rubrivivax sp.]|nr:ABC transporter ATP-binding protein [Burkholderiales bacterium]HNU11512.1 ABC transporter ATP-binding protein [Rubrivivax sp.]